MRKFIPFLIAITVAGCGGTWSNEDLLFLAAIPDRAQLESKLPGTVQTGSDETMQQAACLSTSDMYESTRSKSLEFNQGLFHILAQIERALRTRPSERLEHKRVWGPIPHEILSGVLTRLVAERRPPQTPEDPTVFLYALEIRLESATDEDWVAFIAGRSETLFGLRHVGTIVVDFDAVRGLGLPVPDGVSEFARMEMDYDTTTETLRVGLAVVGTPTASFVRAESRYAEELDGGGRMGFALLKDIVPGPGIEMLLVRSNWVPSGAGRVQVDVSGGDLGLRSGTRHECWDAAGCLTWQTDFQAVTIFGQEVDCTVRGPAQAP